MKNKSYFIDDITWNDLSMEDVYNEINTAKSSVGQEFLKKLLRTTILEENALKDRSSRAEYFSNNPEIRKKLQKIFTELGKTKKLSLYDYIFRFSKIKPSGNGLHYILIAFLLIAIALIFINPVIGILALVLMFVVNIGTYFKYKAAIESYFMCFKYIVRMLRAGRQIKKQLAGIVEIVALSSAASNTADTLGEVKATNTAETSREGAASNTEVCDCFIGIYNSLDLDLKALSRMERGSWLLTNSVSGSLVDVVMDYVRMLFHVDIIKFNQMRKLAADNAAVIDDLFKSLGELEADICISLYREQLKGWCKPQFSKAAPSVTISNMYHPLTKELVKNSIDTACSVLLTGSNASGKSTFLKQLAINQIFAQTIYTCLADSYETSFCKVISSMALTDNILGNESYFIVEIKSLKRIFDSLEPENGTPVMCFIDEVLRGTNTKERIAASSQILKSLAKANALCFAATHDIELTQLLKEDMSNYHFEESVEGSDVHFDYLLKKGPATSRNAIRLMQSYGFDAEIISAANQLADSL